MAILGQVNPGTPNTEVLLYAPGAGISATVFVIFANRNTAGGVARVKLIHRPGAGPTVPENEIVPGKGVPLSDERVSFQFDVTNPEEILVETDTLGVVMTCNGIERS